MEAAKKNQSTHNLINTIEVVALVTSIIIAIYKLRQKS